MAMPSAYDNFHTCHMLTAEPSTYPFYFNVCFDRAIWWKSTECVLQTRLEKSTDRQTDTLWLYYRFSFCI